MNDLSVYYIIVPNADAMPMSNEIPIFPVPPAAMT